MTLPHEADPAGELADFLAGDEPDWAAPPEPPRDARKANAMLHRLGRIRARRAADRAVAEEQIRQVVAWQAEREGAYLRQEEWLEEALARYHRAVLSIDPERLTINLPAGRLESRMGQPQWAVTDPDACLAWLLDAAGPDAGDAEADPILDPDDELAAARSAYLEAVDEILRRRAGAVYALAVKVPDPPPPTVSLSGLKKVATIRDEHGKPVAWGVTPTGEPVPGVTVEPPERGYKAVLAGPEPYPEPAWDDEPAPVPDPAEHTEDR